MKSFIYQGRRFTPVRSFTPAGAGLSLYQLTRIFGFRRTVMLDGYDHTDFYQAATRAGAADIDLFRCQGALVCPCQDFLGEVVDG